jgi:hypothetical protein
VKKCTPRTIRKSKKSTMKRMKEIEIIQLENGRAQIQRRSHDAEQ